MFKRVNFIDSLRGGGMFLVFLHHIGILQSYILVFHMPLFFFIAGYLHSLKHTQDSFILFFKKKFNRLLIPYFLFEIINLLSAIGVQKLFLLLHFEEVYHINFFYALRNIFICLETPEYIGVTNLFWFFPCMFISEILFWCVQAIITKINNQHNHTVFLLVALLFVLASYLLHIFTVIRLPFTLDISLMATSFIALGNGLSFIIEYCKSQNKVTQCLATVVGIGGVILCAKMNTEFLMFINQYGNYLYSYIGAVCGIYGFINFTLLITQNGETTVFKYLSDNSLVFYPVHLNIIALVTKILSYINLEVFVSFILFYPIFKGIICLVLIIPCIWVINKYFPILSGKYSFLT